jgi:hypothetical protein
MLSIKKTVGIAAVTFMCSAMAANSALVLKIEDNNSAASTTIFDGGAGDTSAITGIITFSASSLYGMSIQVDTAISGLTLGLPFLDLNTSSLGAGSIKVTTWDAFFTSPGPGSYIAQNSTTTNGDGATVYDATTAGTPLPQILGTGVSSALVNIGGPFAMLTSVNIDHTGLGLTAFTDADSFLEVGAIPLPAAGFLLFGALGGLGLMSRKRKAA